MLSSLKPVIKIIVGTMQIISGFTAVLGVSFPSNFSTFLLRFVSLFRLDFATSLGLGCGGSFLKGYTAALSFNLIMLVLVVIVVTAVYEIQMKKLNNPDMEITEEENRAQLRETFGRFDKDGDGIDIEEVALICQKVDPDATREEIETLFQRADTDGGGVIDFEEFYAAVTDANHEGGLDLSLLVMKQKRMMVKADAAGRLFLLAFLLYPGLTTKLFEGFICRDIGGGTSVLLVDYAIECNGMGYNMMWIFCAGGVILWPIGLPALMFYKMYRARSEILAQDEDTLATYAFMLGDYGLEHWYWALLAITDPE